MAKQSPVDIHPPLISPVHSSKTLIILALACLAWIVAISMAVVYFMGTAVSTGWIVGGVLLLALVVWIVVMLREVRNAIEMPTSDDDDTMDAPDPSALVRSRSEITDSRKMTPERGQKSRTRKRRSDGARLPGFIA